MMHTEIYRGKIEHCDNGQEKDLITLSGLDGPYRRLKEVLADAPEKEHGDYRYPDDYIAWPLAEIIQHDIEEHGNYLTVRYYISSTERTEAELAEEYGKIVCGLGDVEYHMAYSETTGYLWTDESLDVGGHDLLAELRSYVGSWLHLQIDYSREASAIG